MAASGGTTTAQKVREMFAKLDLPVVFFEFGSDAFNAREFREDQVSQAMILKDQWQEMYNKAAGNGEEGNSIGAFIFEWRDEWWKYVKTEIRGAPRGPLAGRTVAIKDLVSSGFSRNSRAPRRNASTTLSLVP